MKHHKINIKVIATSVITIPLALIFPSSAVADEPQNVEKNVVEYTPVASKTPTKVPTLTFTLPILSESIQKEIVAPSNVQLDFTIVQVKAVENPEIEIERQRVIAEKKAVEEKKIVDEKAAVEKKIADEKAAKEKAEAEKKAAEEKKVADEKKAEELRLAATKAVERDDNGFGVIDEYEHFMPTKIEPMSDIDDKLVTIAATGLGKPYVWGGTTPAGWDCSGYVQWAYKQAGIDIPRVNQWTAGEVTTNPVPGDIVVQNGGSHVGIYAGGGMMYSALNPDQGTKFHPVNLFPSYFVHIDR